MRRWWATRWERWTWWVGLIVGINGAWLLLREWAR